MIFIQKPPSIADKGFAFSNCGCELAYAGLGEGGVGLAAGLGGGGV
jgi:hypothetical protein